MVFRGKVGNPAGDGVVFFANKNGSPVDGDVACRDFGFHNLPSNSGGRSSLVLLVL